MGIVWETYHKGVPLLGVPENTLDLIMIVGYTNYYSTYNVLSFEWLPIIGYDINTY